MWRSYPQEKEEGYKMTSQNNNDDEEDMEVETKKTEPTVKASLTMQTGGKTQDPPNVEEEIEGLKQPPRSPRQNKVNTIDLTDLLSDTDDDEEDDHQIRPSRKEENKQLTVNQHAAASKGIESFRKKKSDGIAAYVAASEAMRKKGVLDQNEDRSHARSAERRPMFSFGHPCGWPDFIERRKKKACLRGPEEGIEESTDDSSPLDPSDPSSAMSSNKATDLQDQKVAASAADKQNDDEKTDISPKSPIMTARPTVHEVETQATSSEALAKLHIFDSHKVASSSLNIAAPSAASDELSMAKAGGMEALVGSLSSRNSTLNEDEALVLPSRRTGCISHDSPVSKSREEGIIESSKGYRGWSRADLERSLSRSQRYGVFNEKTEQIKQELQSRTDRQKTSVSFSPGTPSNLSKGTSPAGVSDRSFVGSRVAKEFFDGKTYFGTVVSFSPVRRLWFVSYDDGDREEMDADEIACALELFKKNDKNLALSSHANMILDTREKNVPSDEDVETPEEDLFSSIPDDAFRTLDSLPQKRSKRTKGESGMEEDVPSLSGKTDNAVMDEEKSIVESSRRRKKFSFLSSSRFLKRKAGDLYSNAAASLRKVGESVPGKHSGSNDSEECNFLTSSDVEPPEKTQEDVYESHPDENKVVGMSDTSKKQSDVTEETVSPPPAKKTKTTIASTTTLEVHPRASGIEESPFSASTGKDDSKDETPAVATNVVVNATQNTNSDSESVCVPHNERNLGTDCNENEDNEIDSSKREECEGQSGDDVETLRRDEDQEEEFGFISTEDHTLEPYTENEMTIVGELFEEEEPKDGLADISIGTLVAAGFPLVVLAINFWVMGMVEVSSSLLEALIRAPFQLALLGVGSQYPIAVVGCILTMFYLAAQEISARTMYTFDGQFYVAMGALVLGVVTATAFAVALRVKPTRMWDTQYILPLVSLLLTNSITSVVLSMDSVCESTASYDFSQDTSTGPIGTSLSPFLWTNAIHKGAIPTMNMLQKVGTMNVPVVMAGLILGAAAGGGEMKATVPVAAKYCLLLLFLSALCTFSTIFTTVSASVEIVIVSGNGCVLRS